MSIFSRYRMTLDMHILCPCHLFTFYMESLKDVGVNYALNYPTEVTIQLRKAQ